MVKILALTLAVIAVAFIVINKLYHVYHNARLIPEDFIEDTVHCPVHPDKVYQGFKHCQTCDCSCKSCEHYLCLSANRKYSNFNQ